MAKAAKENLKSLFTGKDTKAEERKEAKAVKTGKISPAQYARGEKMEGEGKGAMKRGKDLKSGKMSTAAYVAKAKK